jgi:(4S)-4-hydroxy-5-phosphonooxypentane-2,3-dione isomerase
VLVVHVHVHVLPERVDDCITATLANAAASLTEPGVLRCSRELPGAAVRDQADPAHVILVEVYRDEAAAKAHKDTPHYATWRDAVADLMAVPRTSARFDAVFPAESERWAV